MEETVESNPPWAGLGGEVGLWLVGEGGEGLPRVRVRRAHVHLNRRRLAAAAAPWGGGGEGGGGGEAKGALGEGKVG